LYGCETCCFILTVGQDEGVREQGAEEAIWDLRGGNKKETGKKTA